MIRLKIVTNRKICKISLEENLKRVLEKNLTKGFVVDSIVLREKDLSPEEYEALYIKIKEITDYYGIKLFAHKNWNSKACMEGGRIHLSYNSFKNIVSSRINREKFFEKYREIGVSVHSVEDALMAENFGATYVTFGHVFPTECKRGLEPRGMDKLREVCLSVDIPVFAIGGMDRENAEEAVECGAYGICIMSGIMKL